MPGSSQPQDLGSISYKDTETSETSQQIESVDTTATVVTETFQAEEKILPQDFSPICTIDTPSFKRFIGALLPFGYF